MSSTTTNNMSTPLNTNKEELGEAPNMAKNAPNSIANSLVPSASIGYKRKASIDIDELKTKKTKTEAEFLWEEDSEDEDDFFAEAPYLVIKFAVQQEFTHTMNNGDSWLAHCDWNGLINEFSTLEEACAAADWEQANECSGNEIVLVADGYKTSRYNAFNQSYFDGMYWFKSE